ncbi:MAG: methyltransferase domain-containing protein [Candidatus Heimdallarchaeaceae archaeon]
MNTSSENNKNSLEDMLTKGQIGTVFSVNWIELEILRILNRTKQSLYKGEVIQILRSRSIALSKKPDSSFYSIFEKLKEEGFLSFNKVEGKGYRAYLELTEKGKVELTKALNWGLNTLLESMSFKLVENLNAICRKYMECNKKQSFGIISVGNPNLLVPEVCNSCVNASDECKFKRYNIFMPFAKDIQVEYFQNIRATYDDIPLKTNLLDRFMSALNLGLIAEEQQETFLKEIYRLLKPGGRAAFFELRRFESYLFDALETITDGLSNFLAKKETQTLRRFKKKELMRIFGDVFGENNVEVIKLKEFLLTLVTK